MLDQFSATVEKIYAAAADQSKWPEALTAIQDLSGSTAVVVNLVSKQRLEDSLMLLTPSVYALATQAELASYNDDVLPHCPRVAAGVEHPDAAFICDYMILSEAEMDRNLAYEWYGRHGLRYFVGAPLLETSRYRVMWSFQRSRRQGHPQQKDIDLFLMLSPHVARALSLADQLGTLRSSLRFSSVMLEALPQAVFALDTAGALVFANPGARRVLAAGDGLTVHGGRLSAALSSEQARLDSMIRSATVPMDSSARGWTRVTRPSGRPPYAVFIAQLSIEDGELGAEDAKVLVMVHDTAQHHEVSVEMLAAVYGLTETEARLASAISAGHSLESAAALLHVQIATARSHLKSVFAKLGVNRQQDLVRLLTSLSTVKL